MLTELQGPDVGDDRPAIGRRDLRAIVRHHTEAVGHHVEEIAHRRRPQPGVVKRRGLPVAALHNHAAPASRGVVAGRAVDVEALLAALEHVRVDGDRQHVDRRLAVLAGEERLIFVQRAARHRAFHVRPSARSVREERRGPERAVLRLIVHVLTAGGDAGQAERGQCEPSASSVRFH
jgi:hypothetical protein